MGEVKLCPAPHPEGPREAGPGGYCSGHYKRKQRRQPLDTPLKSGEALVLVGVRVPEAVSDALDKEAKRSKLTRSDVAREILEGWVAEKA